MYLFFKRLLRQETLFFFEISAPNRGPLPTPGHEKVKNKKKNALFWNRAVSRNAPSELHVKRTEKMDGIYAICTLDMDLALALLDEHRDVVN